MCQLGEKEKKQKKNSELKQIINNNGNKCMYQSIFNTFCDDFKKFGMETKASYNLFYLFIYTVYLYKSFICHV